MYFVWEPSELKKSPYKMYERNPHTKCMRVVLSAEVKSAEAISKKSKIQEKSHASPRTTSSGAARAAPGGATRDDKQLFYGSNDLLWRLVKHRAPPSSVSSARSSGFWRPLGIASWRTTLSCDSFAGVLASKS